MLNNVSEFVEAYWVMDHREIGTCTHLGAPFKMSKTPASSQRPAPCLGEHTEYVCRELLGMPQEKFDELLIEGVSE